MAEVGFIGLGNMGGPMATNLVKAGHNVAVFDLSHAACDQLKEKGASVAGSAVEAATGVELCDFDAASWQACCRNLSWRRRFIIETGELRYDS